MIVKDKLELQNKLKLIKRVAHHMGYPFFMAGVPPKSKNKG